MDRFSPCVLASVRTLVLPVGHIERRRFLNFLSRLQKEAWIVNLTDTERYVGDDDLLLSSKSFTNGSIFFNYSTTATSPQREQLSPFELFREPLLVLGVVDGQGNQEELNQKELGAGVLRERYPRVVHRQLLILEDGNTETSEADHGAIRIANAGDEDNSALKDAVCRITARFLKELSTYTRAMQASPSVQTPGQTARKLQRTNSQRDQENRPSSGHSTPTQSMDLSSPVDRDGNTKAPPLDRASPATTFDQIPSASNSASNISRSDSRASSKGKQNRSSSQDRVSVQGFGSGTSQDKLKQRGKARVGIVIGSIYMVAGQWSEALKILTEHTNKARLLSDHIWHAKGLENIIVCLLLHSWAGMEFQIPSICYPVTDKSSGQQGFSLNLPSDFKVTDAAQLASVRRLSTSLPDLLKLVLSLYRSVEGSLELPHVCNAEATIRFSKLLAVLHKAGGELEHSALDELITSKAQTTTSNATKPAAFSKAAIAEMLASAHPPSEDPLQASEQIIILSGIASVYALLRMERKRASVLKDLVARLATALTEARKRGAAEAGIHPAASISAEAGADGVLALSEDSEGITSMVAAIARVYGAYVPVQNADRAPAQGENGFGSELLKLSILKQIVALYEAAPDPHGLVQTTSAILSAFGVNGAVDVIGSRYTGILSKDDQARLHTNLTRTVGVSRHLGLPDVETTYWDRHLVRGLEFVLPDPNLRVVERKLAKSRPGTATSEPSEPSGTGGNPLLYDPNANRPGTGPTSSETAVLVAHESAVCLITLQNPYDIAVDIESLSLVSEDLELRGDVAPFTLQAQRLQQIPLTVYPSVAGDCKIEQVRIKVRGCLEESFPIVSKAWAPEPSRLVKDIGQRIGETQSSEQSHIPKAEHAVVSLKVVESQPLLIFEKPALQNPNIMLLDGENHSLELVVRNKSNMAVSIFDVLKTRTLKGRPTSNLDKGSSSVGETVPMEAEVLIEPSQTKSFKFNLKGRADVARIQLTFMYGTVQEEHEYARVLRMAIDLTVNAALQAQHFTFQPAEEDESFMLSFDLRNAWPHPLEYTVMDEVGTLHPGQIERIYQVMPTLPADKQTDYSTEHYAKMLQERLSIKWSCEGRTGDVDLSGLALSNEEMEVVARAPVTLSLTLISASRPSSSGSADPEQVVKAGSFVTLAAKVSIAPRVIEPLFLLLHVRPQDSSDEASTLRPGALVNGAAHRILRPTGEEQSVEFSLCALLAGKVELEVTAKSAVSSNKTAPIVRRTLEMSIV